MANQGRLVDERVLRFIIAELRSKTESLAIELRGRGGDAGTTWAYCVANAARFGRPFFARRCVGWRVVASTQTFALKPS